MRMACHGSRQAQLCGGGAAPLRGRGRVGRHATAATAAAAHGQQHQAAIPAQQQVVLVPVWLHLRLQDAAAASAAAHTGCCCVLPAAGHAQGSRACRRWASAAGVGAQESLGGRMCDVFASTSSSSAAAASRTTASAQQQHDGCQPEGTGGAPAGELRAHCVPGATHPVSSVDMVRRVGKTAPGCKWGAPGARQAAACCGNAWQAAHVGAQRCVAAHTLPTACLPALHVAAGRQGAYRQELDHVACASGPGAQHVARCDCALALHVLSCMLHARQFSGRGCCSARHASTM